MGMPNTPPENNSNINVNLDDILAILNQSSNINSEAIKRLIENKDDLVKIVNDLKCLFTKEQLKKIEKGIYELNDILLKKNQFDSQSEFINSSPINCAIPTMKCVMSPINCVNEKPNKEDHHADTFLYLVLFFLLAILILPKLSCKRTLY